MASTHAGSEAEGARERRPYLIYNQDDDSWAELCGISPQHAALRAYGRVPKCYAIQIPHNDVEHDCHEPKPNGCTPRYYSKRNRSYFACRARASRAFAAGYDPLRLPD